MVMHARKPHRISDGYFEKHQAHPYQKYNSKRANEYGSTDHYTPLRSPNGNMSHGHNAHGHTGHAHHHYHMVDDRGYVTSRNSYVPKGSEKERDRDYKSSRNKYTDVRSPKEKRKDSEREKNNHERCESEKKSRTSGMNSVNSSSKYYKRGGLPANAGPSSSEWSEHISSSGKKYYYNSELEVSQWEKPKEWDSRKNSSKDHQTTYTTSSSRGNREKRSRSRRREIEKTSKRTNNTSERYWSASRESVSDRTRTKHTPHSGHDTKEGHRSLQDMDISPDRSTPVSEGSHGVRNESTAPPVVILNNSNPTSGSLLAAALPRIVAPAQASTSGLGPGPSTSSGPPCNNGASDSRSETPQRDAGPPTPTHSENIDPHAPPLHLENALPRKKCLGSYSSVVGSLQQAAPMLTPSLINYVRTELTAHVIGWPADILEKQANKYMEEAHQLGCLQCTRVSAELKCSRSVVRHTEIQATLQEQKIMYLRQQISRLEELKSQNSFMSED
ncbi:WW domain-containing adapter protein with coiled-coil homolog isoform X3 [Pieris brassicae]|uniref:WW domain-containing adapter protein with coiled-coil homolog isoform X3 n=1 Tax=Pieris brassicae TaxID=7116 RepID=UPI001E6625B8|nr:WW domain-containing adapter protein with coiled-coil homolog isoform X3 [Pieris brassicae]